MANLLVVQWYINDNFFRFTVDADPLPPGYPFQHLPSGSACGELDNVLVAPRPDYLVEKQSTTRRSWHLYTYMTK